MRKRDKLKNIEQANLMLEQSYLKSKGLINEENVDSIQELLSNLYHGRPVNLNSDYEENKNKFNEFKMVKLKTIDEGSGNESFVAISELEKLEFFLFKIESTENGNKITIYRDTDGSLINYLPKNFIPVRIDGYFGVVKGEDGYNKCRDIYRGSCIKWNG